MQPNCVVCAAGLSLARRQRGRAQPNCIVCAAGAPRLEHSQACVCAQVYGDASERRRAPTALLQVVSALPRPLQGFAQHQRCAALDGTPPGRGPGEVSARAGRSGWCTWRAACLRRAARSARSPRPCGAPFGCGFRARTVVWRAGASENRRRRGFPKLQGHKQYKRPARYKILPGAVTVSRGLFPPKSAQGG